MFKPYSVEVINKKFYIRVISYNPMVWYPWSSAYISKNGYPVKLDMIKYATAFDTIEEAEKFINTIY